MLAYIAGPLFNEKEREFLEDINGVCRAIGMSTYLPSEDGVVSATTLSADHDTSLIEYETATFGLG